MEDGSDLKNTLHATNNGIRNNNSSHEDKSLNGVMRSIGTEGFVWNPIFSKTYGLPATPILNILEKDKNEIKLSGNNVNPKIIAAQAAFNEEEYIGTMVLATLPYVDEVIVVDDGSSDRTAKIAELAGARVIRHNVNMGKGRAIQTILEEAKRIDADTLVLLDADCQHNPDEIPLLLEPLRKGEADIVNGSRFLDKKSKIPLYRKVGQHVLTISTNLASGSTITDSQSGFRALSRRAIHSIRLFENGMGVESEMINNANESCLRIKEVPITCRYDVNGSTFNPVSHGIRVLGTITNHMQRKYPLYYFGLPGIILFITGGVLSIETFYAYKILGQFWIGKALLAIVLLLAGILAMFSGLILNSIANMMKELKSPGSHG